MPTGRCGVFFWVLFWDLASARSVSFYGSAVEHGLRGPTSSVRT